MEKFIANAFSLQMLDWSNKDEITIKIKKVAKPETFDGYTSATQENYW